jgi:hypothetical protein
MSSPFSDKPMPRPPPPEAEPANSDEPRFLLPPRRRFNVRRFLAGISLLLLLIGVLLLLFIPGGLARPIPGLPYAASVRLDAPGHIIGFILIGAALLGFILLWSFEKTN